MNKLWHFKCTLIKTPYEVNLVRLEHRSNVNFFGNSRHRDFDFSGKLETKLKRDDLIPKVKELLSSLSFEIPIPIAPEAAALIFGFRNFPSAQEWEDAGYYYPPAMLQEHARMWWESRGHPKDEQGLFAWFANVLKHVRKHYNIQDRAAYARMNLHLLHDFKISLNAFYKIEIQNPEPYFSEMVKIGNSHFPEKAHNTKKNDASPTGTDKKRRGQKGKVIDYPNLFR